MDKLENIRREITTSVEENERNQTAWVKSNVGQLETYVGQVHQ
jgi:hypothetical protein